MRVDETRTVMRQDNGLYLLQPLLMLMTQPPLSQMATLACLMSRTDDGRFRAAAVC